MSKDFLINSSINWYKWCDKTFEIAKKENKAIFIFIGYELCGLCEDMKTKVLEDKNCSEILNRDFISIYIDKDERNDLDKYFQKAHQLLNRKSGSWPLSIFCTPQNKPFYARTYIPLESSQTSIEEMGFLQLLNLINQKVKNSDNELFKNADEIEGFLQKNDKPNEATVLKNEFYKNFILQAENNYDTKYAGFGTSPKFLHLNVLKAHLKINEYFDDTKAKEMLLNTLDIMQNSDINDKEDKGFFRCSMSQDWQNPIKEKTLYDNALLCEIYLKAYEKYTDASYLKTAKDCADFCCKNLSQNNLFYSSSQIKENKTLVDKKIQTSLNSMIIKSLFLLSKEDESYKDKAVKSLKALLDAVYIDDKLYHFTSSDTNCEVEAFLDDYAFISVMLIQAYKSTKEEHYIIYAQKFINTALEKFYADASWLYTNGEHQSKADAMDNNTTSTVSTIINAMLDLGVILNDEKYIHFAFKSLEYNSYELARKALLHPSLIIEMFKYLKITSKN